MSCILSSLCSFNEPTESSAARTRAAWVIPIGRQRVKKEIICTERQVSVRCPGIWIFFFCNHDILMGIRRQCALESGMIRNLHSMALYAPFDFYSIPIAMSGWMCRCAAAYSISNGENAQTNTKWMWMNKMLHYFFFFFICINARWIQRTHKNNWTTVVERERFTSFVP